MKRYLLLMQILGKKSKKFSRIFLRDIHPIYEDLRLYKQTESQGGEIEVEFSDFIDRITQKLDAHLPKILPILVRYNKVENANVGIDFLHIWRGFGAALSGTLHCYHKKIHMIVDAKTRQISFGEGFPNKWSVLFEQVNDSINQTNKL